MKDLLVKKLDSGFILKVQFDDDGGPLAVRLDNSKNEFVGQLFASFDTVRASVERLSNYTVKLTDEEFKKIKKDVVDASTPAKK